MYIPEHLIDTEISSLQFKDILEKIRLRECVYKAQAMLIMNLRRRELEKLFAIADTHKKDIYPKFIRCKTKTIFQKKTLEKWNKNRIFFLKELCEYSFVHGVITRKDIRLYSMPLLHNHAKHTITNNPHGYLSRNKII